MNETKLTIKQLKFIRQESLTRYKILQERADLELEAFCIIDTKITEMEKDKK